MNTQNLPPEMWAPFLEYPQFHVSTHGLVFNTKTQRILRGSKDSHGYLKVSGPLYSFRIHRAIAVTFIPNPYCLPQVNHIDGNKLHNYVWNLEWCDASYNQQHALRMGLNPISGCCAKMVGIVAIHLETQTELHFDSLAACSRALGINAGNISRIMRGIEYTYHGWTFWRERDWFPDMTEYNSDG